MNCETQKQVANDLRELADKVERSSYCRIEWNDERCSVVYNKGGKMQVREPTGERAVSIQLRYLEEKV